MSEIPSSVGPLPHIPDDLTIPQFLLDSRHPVRPLNAKGNPWFIEELTGRAIGLEEVRARTYGLANALSARWKIGNEDVVCIFSPNHVYYPISVWAVHRLGAIVTGANPAYTADELTYQLTATKAALLITHTASLSSALTAARDAGISQDRIVLIDSPEKPDGQFLTLDALVQEGLAQGPTFVEPRLSPGEARTKLALLNFSSGTTGRPKAVAIPHYAVIANVIQMAVHSKANEEYTSWEERRYRPGDVTYSVLPFYHIYGLVVNLHFYLFCGYSLVVSTKFNFLQMLKSIERYKISHLLLVPPMIVLMCKNPATKQHDLSSVRFMMSGAAPLSADLIQQVIRLLPDVSIHQAYGMTETSTTVTWPRLDLKVGTPGSSGTVLAGVVAKVVKEDGTLAKRGEPGELYVKAPSAALRYLNNEQATKETFIDGWIRTGDEVIINELNEVFIVDRMKEIMKVRGFQVAPAELEGHLLNHPDVTDVCVVGVPDEYSGEVPLAFVVLSQAAQERIKKDPKEADRVKADIMKFVADNKVHYKKLAGGVEFIDIIPKNPSGKLLRRFLRDKARELRKSQASVKAKL
ncbi:amp dependent CoA ligase [Panus rudis PR-1116 ss-1]|nr:amp dependent CoA ligase [Panus rudis PR-1116 ss-1]